MKTELSSVDVHVLVGELRGRLVGARVDKAYQVGKKEIVLRLYGGGQLDLVAAPTYICLTSFRRPMPQQPSPFAMQLRKRLGGARIMDVVQHGFDRIVELVFDGHVLVFEVFSKGNVVLCGEGMRILGLLDWQRWKDRTLGVGRTYEYPPPVLNPLMVDEAGFAEVLSGSGRGVASTLATKLGLGGFYAEYVCRKADADPKADYGGVDGGRLWLAFHEFMSHLDSPTDARLLDDNVVPYADMVEGGTPYVSYNEAVDEYFSRREEAGMKETAQSAADAGRKKLEEILGRQLEALERVKENAANERLKGDLIYQRMGSLEEAADAVRKMRKAGSADKEIVDKLGERGVRGLRGFRLTVDL